MSGTVSLVPKLEKYTKVVSLLGRASKYGASEGMLPYLVPACHASALLGHMSVAADAGRTL